MPNKSFRITAKWDLEDHHHAFEPPKIDISKLSVEEQQDLIVEKLKTPPRKPRSAEEEIEEMLAEIMAHSIQDEIDAEIVKSLQNLKKEGKK